MQASTVVIVVPADRVLGTVESNPCKRASRFAASPPSRRPHGASPVHRRANHVEQRAAASLRGTTKRQDRQWRCRPEGTTQDVEVRIWIDGDAVPGAVKEIILRAAQRLKVEAVLVANKDVRVGQGPFARFVRVGKGAD